jgi:hypothetical protein
MDGEIPFAVVHSRQPLADSLTQSVGGDVTEDEKTIREGIARQIPVGEMLHQDVNGGVFQTVVATDAGDHRVIKDGHFGVLPLFK